MRRAWTGVSCSVVCLLALEIQWLYISTVYSDPHLTWVIGAVSALLRG